MAPELAKGASMARAAGKYLGSFSLGLRGALEYRANFFFSLLGAVAPVIIQTALWTCLYAPAPGGAEGAGGGGPGSGDSLRLFGFTYAQMLGYVVVANVVSRLVRTGFEYDLNDDIRSGGLDRYLVKPIDYFGFRMAQFVGSKAAETVFMGAALAVAIAVLSAATGFPVGLSAILGFAAALFLAFLLNFLIFWCVGLAGFWLTEIGFFFEAVRIVIITASGGIFPLSVFGPGPEAFLDALPFRFTIQFPTDVLCGRVAGAGLASGLALAAAWSLALYALGRGLWSIGVRRFVAVGS
jgi:ABC-2 type transport system permease protein